MASSDRRYWYAAFRMASFANTLGALVWTALMVLPFAPFSSVPPIMVAGGPGLWLVIGYILFIIVGAGGFGWLSGILHTIEVGETRRVDPLLMGPGFVLLCFGVILSCALLAAAGTIGGYASTISGGPVTPLREILTPYVYPVTTSVLAAVAGACLVLLAMIRARGP